MKPGKIEKQKERKKPNKTHIAMAFVFDFDAQEKNERRYGTLMAPHVFNEGGHTVTPEAYWEEYLSMCRALCASFNTLFCSMHNNRNLPRMSNRPTLFALMDALNRVCALVGETKDEAPGVMFPEWVMYGLKRHIKGWSRELAWVYANQPTIGVLQILVFRVIESEDGPYSPFFTVCWEKHIAGFNLNVSGALGTLETFNDMTYEDEYDIDVHPSDSDVESDSDQNSEEDDVVVIKQEDETRSEDAPVGIKQEDDVKREENQKVAALKSYVPAHVNGTPPAAKSTEVVASLVSEEVDGMSALARYYCAKEERASMKIDMDQTGGSLLLCKETASMYPYQSEEERPAVVCHTRVIQEAWYWESDDNSMEPTNDAILLEEMEL